MAVSSIDNLRFDGLRGKHLLVALSGGADYVWFLSAATAAAEYEHQRKDDDPSAIVVKQMAKTVIHSQYSFVAFGRFPSSQSIYAFRSLCVRRREKI